MFLSGFPLLFQQLFNSLSQHFPAAVGKKTWQLLGTPFLWRIPFLCISIKIDEALNFLKTRSSSLLIIFFIYMTT
jgi:hypothetical protein